MSGSLDYFDNTVNSVVSSPLDEAMTPVLEMTTSLPTLDDVIQDVQTEEPAMTLASVIQTVVTTQLDDFNFTNFYPDTVEASSVLMPLHSLWTLFPLLFMTTFLIGWLLRLRFWYYYERLLAALGIEGSELTKPDGTERVPTEVASARLLRATKNEQDFTAVIEVDGERDSNTIPNGDPCPKVENGIVTVRL